MSGATYYIVDVICNREYARQDDSGVDDVHHDYYSRHGI